MKSADQPQSNVWRLGRRIVFAASVSIGLALAIIVAQSAVPGEVAATGINGPAISSSGTVSAGNAVLRTWDDMARDANMKPSAGVVPGAIINAPTIPLGEYNSLKAWAAQAHGVKGAGSSGPSGPLAPSIKGVNFAGSVQGENGEGFVPPDTHMATGVYDLVETTNSSIDVWSKVSSGTPALLKSVSQNSFVGNATDSLGDARVIFDSTWKRWIITIDDFSGLTNGSKPSYYLAVSTTVLATRAFYVFAVKIGTTPSGLFYDYPQLGQDQDGILFTANMFNGNSFFGSMVHSIAKARVFNGLGFSFGVFFASSGSGTLAPPILVNGDQNPSDFFLSAPVGSGVTALNKYTMTNSSRTQKNTDFAGPVAITVGSYITPPPPALQQAPCNVAADDLDSLDGRFQNASYQAGTVSANVHTITIPTTAFPAPHFYQVNNATNTVVQEGTFFKSASSYDMNPHISGVGLSFFVTWTATDPLNLLNAQVMFGGRVAPPTDPLGVMNVSGSAFSSPACITGSLDPNFGLQRWGDYSSVSMDPSFSGIAWILNETTPSSADWGTRGVRIGN